MTIHERMVARSEREKDLLKYGRGQEQERIIKLLEENLESWEEGIVFRKGYNIANVPSLIALIKGEK